MKNAHLEYLLGALSDRPRNTYGPEVHGSIYTNWIATIERLEIPHEVTRDDRGFPSISLLRGDGSQFAVIEPVLLPGCPVRSRAICRDKILTAQILTSKGIHVPRTKVYSPSEREQAMAETFPDDAEREVVVKAQSLSLGKGVFLSVQKDSFDQAFRECAAVQQRARRPQILVQEMHPGFEMRATVMEGVLHNVMLRMPAYVVGDGTSTLDQLIDLKNEERAKDGFFKTKPIRRDANMLAHLKVNGLDLEWVPADQEPVLLSSISNSSYGGETAVVTDLVSPQIREIALHAAAAIPGVTSAGIDVMATSFDDEEPVVLEINTFPHAHLSLYPTFGDPADGLSEFVERFLVRDALAQGRGLENSREREIADDYLAFYQLKDALAVRST